MALELGIPIIQIVGFQNSGKTTFITRLVDCLSKEGLSVGVIKHHGHGGQIQLGDTGKDTEKHRHAGAKVVSVEGEGVIQITAQDSKWELQKTLNLYEQFDLDTIIIEGYKKENFPKVVMIQDPQDLKLLHKLTNIFCVISTFSVPKEEIKSFSYFDRDEENAYLKFVTEKMRGIS
jgi:molybdopterin-guanine dinucleotide biosynthesis adapter protein